MLASLLQGVASSQPGPAECVPALAMSSVAKGMQGTGWTVVTGKTPRSFNVEVLGVMKDAILPGRDLIVAEISGPVVDAGDGVWFGMSGSPVYVMHGGQQRLLGAVAWGFAWGPSPIVGLTTGPDIVALAKGAGTTVQAFAEPTSVELDDEMRVAIAARAPLTVSQIGEMQRMPVPLSVSGVNGQRMTRLRAQVQKAGLPFIPFTGGSVAASATAPATAMRPGDNFAATLSYGDVTMAGVGTTTYVCNGKMVAFGHPMIFTGPTTLGANTADAITIVKDPIWGAYKLATVGPRVGVVDSDRFTGIAGPLGATVSTIPVTSTVTALDTGRQRTGRTDIVFEDWAADLAFTHAFANVDSVFDQVGKGNATYTMTLTGTREDGRPWRLTRDNRAVSEWDIAFEGLFETYFDLISIVNNPHEEVSLTRVDYRISVDGKPPLRYRIKEVLISADGRNFEPIDEGGGLIVQAGKLVQMRVTLALPRSEDKTVNFAIGVPHDASGFGMIEVRGGPPYRDPWECLFDPEACTEVDADGFAGLLKDLAERPRNDDLFAQLTLFPDSFDGELPHDPDFPDEPMDGIVGPFNGLDGDFSPHVVSTSRKRLDRVVAGERGFQVFVEPGIPPDTSVACPPGAFGPTPFADVWGRAHESSISCMYGLGVVKGATEDLFAPAHAVTRGQMASLIARTLETAGVALPDAGGAAFTDVAGTTHATAIGQLAVAGILEGRTATTFAPGELMTRAQMASALVRAYEYATGSWAPSTSGWFMDIGGTTHERAINAAAEARFVTGVQSGVYGPGQPMRRGQMATTLARLLNTLMIEGGGGFPGDDFGDMPLDE